MASIAQGQSLFEIDGELDLRLDEIEEEIESRARASAELMERFQQFSEAHSEKADRTLPPHDGSAHPVLPERSVSVMNVRRWSSIRCTTGPCWNRRRGHWTRPRPGRLAVAGVLRATAASSRSQTQESR